MKPGYKIIIMGALIYGGFQIKALVDVAPYKDRASQLVMLLKQNKPFDVQTMLGEKLQSHVSIEQIHTVALEYNLSQSSEISWRDWQETEAYYILHGEIIFKDNHTLPAQFTLSSPKQDDIMVDAFTIGKTRFQTEEQNRTGFLE